MAKQRPSLGVAASPVSTFVAPIDPRKTVEPIDEGAIRNAYEFADAFSNLSQTAAKFATTIKTQQNEQDFLAGQDLVNQNRKTYANLVGSGQIKPSENPWLAVGAQQASGVLEAAKARNDFKTAYDNAVLNNPELLKDNQFFDALAASFAEQKNAEFGTSQYLSRSFYKEFNPFLIEQSAKHADAVGQYNQKKIIDSLRLKVDEAVTAFGKVPDFGLREDKTPKDIGFYGAQYGPDGSLVTERSIGVQFDGVETQIPLLVPGLSLEAREAIVYAPPDATPESILDQLDPVDRELIFDHAMKRMREGKSPFYSTLKDKIVPDLQGYLDELGQSLGLPRVANLATASHLIEAMKSSGLTYEAEAILSELKAGTGKLIDVSEVKSMLLEAREDVQKNRFELGKSRETQIVSAWAANAYKDAMNDSAAGNADASYGKYLDEWRTQLTPAFKYLSIEDQAKMWDQFNERWNNATREGREMADRNTKTLIIRNLFDPLEGRNIPKSSEWNGQEIVDFGSLRNKLESQLESFRVSEDAKKKDIRDAVKVEVNNWLNSAPEAAMAKYGLSDLTPSSQDSADVRQLKDQIRMSLKMNEIQAALHFDLEDRLESIRRIALNGISVDVERGLRPELADLVMLYKNSAGGRSPLDILLPKMGDRGARTLKFLQLASVKWSSGVMSLPDAVRDAAQSLNMDAEADILSLTDINKNGTDMQAYRLKVDETLKDLALKGWRGWADWIPFVDPAIELNPDARKSAASMFTRKFVEEMASTSGALQTSMKNARQYVLDNSMIVNGAVLPKDAFAPHGVTESYIAAFIGVELGTDALEKGATLVWVDNAPNGEPVFAFRDSAGNAMKDGYYTIQDIVSREKPRDADGNIIRDAQSPREKVVSFMVDLEKRAKAKKTEAIRRKSLSPIQPKF